ncbi:GNAT family N-acetyltransferase [Micromonospora zamorensis]|uniref:GNAT family N-acetyltransferase n=1 Tax=Micromonospora zamorensis TaxID=709883 RepID=UPI0036C74D57
MTTEVPPWAAEAACALPRPLLFATVSGAHLYGFASIDSDLDLRAVHLLSPSLVEAGVTMRPYVGASDIAGVQAVRAEVHRADGDLWLPGPDTSEDPDGVHPFCLIAQADSGRTVGFTWMDWWSEAADTRVYLLSGCVEPAWHRRGIGSAMLRWQEARAIEFEGSRPVGGRSVFGANVGEECFAGARDGYRPRTYEEYLLDVQDIDMWCVVWAGDDIAAVVVNELQADGTARTPWVAVGTAWRQRGVGLAVMGRTLRMLAEAGVSTARLSTVAENPNDSVGMYEKAGYRVTAWQPRYRKPVEAC